MGICNGDNDEEIFLLSNGSFFNNFIYSDRVCRTAVLQRKITGTATDIIVIIITGTGHGWTYAYIINGFYLLIVEIIPL